MTDFTSQARRWLSSLDENELGVVLSVSDGLRTAAQLPSDIKRASAGRNVNACRAWARKAAAKHLEAAFVSAIPPACDLLIKHHGFTNDDIAAPTEDQFAKMLLAMGRPIGQLVLFALLLTNQPASRHARKNQAVLEKALEDSEFKTLTDLSEHAPGAETDNDESCPVGALAESLNAVRDLATQLAERLRAAATEVDFGTKPEANLEEDLAAYRARHTEMFTKLAEQDRLITEESFVAAEQLIEELREQQIENERLMRERSEQIDMLKQQVETLDSLIALNPNPSLVSARQDCQRQLNELLGIETPEPAPQAQQQTLTDEEQSDTTPALTAVEPEDETSQTVPTEAEKPEPAEQAQAPEKGQEELSCAETAHQTEDETTLDSPWEEGDPPLAVALLRAGKISEAYWVTATSAEPDRRSAVLNFTAAAYNTQSSDAATGLLATLQLDAQDLVGDNDAAVLATTAILRAGLRAGWLPQILMQLRSGINIPGPWQILIDTATDALRHKVHVGPTAGVPPTEDPEQIRVALGTRASELAEELPSRKNTYQRATRALQWLTRDGRPLAKALNTVAAWGNGDDVTDQLAEAVDRFNVQGAVDELIDRADASVCSRKQAREPIIAASRRWLQRVVEEVETLVREAHAVAQRLDSVGSADKSTAGRLSRAIEVLKSEEAPPGMAGAALCLLREWLEDPATVRFSPLTELDESATGIPTTDVLLPLVELPRTSHGNPDPDDPATSEILSRLAQPLDLEGSLTAYRARGDLRSAKRIIQLAEAGFWDAELDVTTQQHKIEEATREWEQHHHTRVVEAKDLFSRVRAQNLLNQVDDSTVGGRIEAVATVTNDDYRSASRRLDELMHDLEEKQAARIQELHTSLDSLTAAETDRERIRELLNAKDAVTASEFLSFLRENKPLPETFDPGTGDLERFTGFLDRGFTRGLDDPQKSVQNWASLARPDTPLSSMAQNGIKAWDALVEPRSRDRLAESVRSILQVLGLDCPIRPRDTSARNQRISRVFYAQGKPIDGSYVSDLGSSAAQYVVTVILNEQVGPAVLNNLDQEDTTKVNIVLLSRAMDLTTRLGLVAHAASRKIKALVVDPAAFGWVAASYPNSWRATQRVTLPWSIYEPYKPFVAGLVPPEVFVGRSDEMSRVMDSNGGQFVYGGRQLGKSALLRRVEATFNEGETKHALYLDLKTKGIGEAEPASRIWRALTSELKTRGVLNPKVSDEAPQETVINHIKTWLAEDSSRRILLLADEADAFLTADSRGEATAGGISHFRNVLGLKELMESTQRRFKVVFAGLHQVQRFGHLSNVPLVHGGPDILIGPLNAVDARRLVTEPIAALGYRFERPELVWRLLSATNYQACLIQIFCEALVKMLHARRGKDHSVPGVITEDDVEAVAVSDHVRGKIVERMRITINLDDRYRVLMLVIALFSLNDSFGTPYSPRELLTTARERWREGFEELTVEKVSIYLDEMVGLGLLSRLPDKKYAVRSPNVINMLGTKADLEGELDDTDFDLPYEYNPREARRLLIHHSEGREVRSPLTEGQLNDLTTGSRVSVITGTWVLGIQRVPHAIKNFAEMRAKRVEEPDDLNALKKAVTDATRRKSPTIIVVDAQGMEEPDLESLIEWIQARDRLKDLTKLSLVLLVAPDRAPEAAERIATTPVLLERWNARSLRSWPECPFDLPATRERLIHATGGWPEMVERTISWVVNRGSTVDHAIEEAESKFSEPVHVQKHVDNCELTPELIASLRTWVEWVEPGEYVTPDDIKSFYEFEVLSEVHELLDTMALYGLLNDGDNGVALEPVVHRHLKSQTQ